MRFVFVFVGVVLMLVGAIIAAGSLLQVAPTTTSVKAWEHVASGGIFYDGVFPISQAFTPTQDTTHSGMSFRFYWSGIGTRTINYEVFCGGVKKGGGSTSYTPYRSTPDQYVQGGDLHLTVTATTSAGVTSAGANCSLTISVTGPGTHYWVRDSSSRIAVVWGEPYSIPPPPAPPPPPPAETTQPPSPVGETTAMEEPLPPIEAAITAVAGEAEGQLLIGAILLVLGAIFILIGSRVG